MNQGQWINERQLRTPPFRIMFPALFEPRAMKGEPPEKAKYSVMMVFDKATTDFSLLNALVESKRDGLKGKTPTRPTFRDGTDKAEHGEPFTAATVFASASTKIKPLVVTASRDMATPDQVIRGSYACAVIHAYSYNHMGNVGISFGLNAVQLLGGGERIESHIDPAALFDAGVMQPTSVPEGMAVSPAGVVAPTGPAAGVPERW